MLAARGTPLVVAAAAAVLLWCLRRPMLAPSVALPRRFIPAELLPDAEEWELELDGRAYLAGSTGEGVVGGADERFPRHIAASSGDFPAFYRFDAGEALEPAALRSFIDAELDNEGCMLLRGLPAADAASFSKLLRSLGYRLTGYVGGVTNRTEIYPLIYPASDEDAGVSMDLHQDNTYWRVQPAKLFFFYERPAARGGLNPLLSVRELATRLPRPFVEELERRRLRYVSFFPDAASDQRFVTWQQSFNTTSRREVEESLRSGGFAFEWSETGLRKFSFQDPWKIHPRTGEKVLASVLPAYHGSYFHSHPSFPELAGVPFADGPGELGEYPFHVTYGDGGEIPYAAIQKLRAIAWRTAVAFRPLAGDLLVIDNHLVQHARLGYEPPRRVWLAISLD